MLSPLAKKKNRFTSLVYNLVVFPTALFLVHCSGKDLREDARFSYKNVYRENYEEGRGGIIPLTIERGESFSGTITPDGKYLYFASNRLGNYDLFLRALDDVAIIPVVKTVTNQREPVISPDGKRLAYIDDELDPDGDLVVLKVNPKDLIKKYEAGENPQSGIFASKPKILTNDEERRVRSREMNPTWSPDGKLLAFSSDMTSATGNPFGPGLGAVQNIWLMDPDKPATARKLTEKGAVMPAFSPDGRKIVYISYQDRTGNGDIYELDLQTQESRQLTSGSALDLNPSYSPDGKFIIFSRIARDTNGDGHIDRKDKAQLVLIPLNGNQTTTEAYPLTTSDENTFDSRASGFVDGSVVFAFASGENINVAFIPTSGVIPRKNSVHEQLAFAAQFHPARAATPPAARQKAHEEYVMALRMVSLFHSGDALAPVLANQARLELFQYLAQRNDPQAAIEKQKIEALAARQEPYLRVLIDLERLQRSGRPLPAATPLLTETNIETYLSKVAASEILQAAYTDTQNDPEGLKLRNIQANLSDRLAARQRSIGRLDQARETERQILQSHPGYYRAAEILYTEAQAGFGEIIPPAALFSLYPEKYPWFTEKDGADFSVKNSLLTAALANGHREKIKVLVYRYFHGLASQGQQVLISAVLDRHPAAQYPELHYMAALAMALAAVDNGQALQAEKLLPKEQDLPRESRWLHLYHRTQGQIHELRNEPGKAFASFYTAFLNYKPEFAIENSRALLHRTLDYYSDRGKDARRHGNYRKAWEHYQVLARLELQLQARDIESDLVEESALDTLVAINELTFADPDEDSRFLQEVQKFYDDNMDFARRYLVNSFIFGRAHLNAQQGILRHERFEKDGIRSSEKKEVLQLFKAAEQDFKWSFFADPWFPDSYVMLGWMYQFIDTKREKIVDIADNTKDKDKFDSLYRTYFPDYLFEESIRIYQKSIDLFSDRVSPRILLSFHLNMGNNYFLLNNYAKAEENYAVVAAAVDRKEYTFESKTQQALFHYHAGRTWYFTGRYNRAAAELRKSLAIYKEIAPLDKVSKKQREINRSRRETIMRQLALNSDLNNRPDEAVGWYREILAEQKYTGAYNDRSFIFLELARLHYDKKDYEQAFAYLREASAALGSEKEVKAPRFKIRIKWFGIYEPWTTVMGWIYQLPYDNVYVGENHLAFPLPTVNRYQYLYSLRADIYRQKGLYPQAKAALLKLQDYARQDKTKHGAETLIASHMRIGELDYLLNNFKSSRNEYNEAIQLATDSGDFVTLQKAEKNLLTIAAKEIESLSENDNDKIKRTEKELKSLEKFTAQYINDRLKMEEETRKEKNRGIELTPAEKARIRLEALKEIYKIAIYKGVFQFYLAELKEAKFRATEKPAKDFPDYLKQKQEVRKHFTTAYKLFQGMVTDPENPDKDISFLDRRDNGMRLALTLNRGRLLQVFDAQTLAAAEYQLAYDRAEEFQASRVKAVAGYRLFEASGETRPLTESYQLFTEHPHLASEYPALFEQISEARTAMYLDRNEAAAAIAAEDLKRFIMARETYRGKIGFNDKELQKKYEEHTHLYTMEVARMKLIETLRLAREVSSPFEAELARIRTDRVKLEQLMISGKGSGQLGPVFYRIEKPENQILPMVYIMENRGKTRFIVADKRTVTSRRAVTTEMVYRQKEFLISDSELKKAKDNLTSGKTDAQPEWLAWLSDSKARQIISDRRFQDFPLEKLFSEPVSVDLALPSARLFGRNHNVTRRRLVQITSTGGGFFGFGGNNAVKYPAAAEQQMVSGLEQWQNTSAGYSVLDYEANLAGSNPAIDRNDLPFYDIMQTAMFPSMVVVHSTREKGLQPQAEFYYRAAVNLVSASRGATAVVYLEGNRKANAAKMPAILTDKITGASAIQGSAAMVAWLKSGEKSASFIQLAAAERVREFDRIREPGKFNPRNSLSRAERARDAEELLAPAGTAADFFESEDLFNIRSSLLLRAGYPDRALADWKNRERLLAKAGQENKIPAAFGLMTSRLFAAGFTDVAMSELRRSNLAPAFDARDWQRILEGYHLSSLINGEIEVFKTKPPADFSRAESQFGIQMPDGVAARVALLTRDSQYLEEWQEALYANLEFRQAYSVQNRRNISGAEHSDFYRAFIYQNLIDTAYSPAWAASWLGDIRKATVSAKDMGEDREEILRDDFVQINVFLRNGDVNRAVEFARQQLVDPTTSREVQDAAIFIFLKDLWKRERDPADEKIILDYLAEAGSILQSTETNRQRRAFQEMLKSSSSLINGTEKLLDAGKKSGARALSAGNQSVMNRLGYFAATWQPRKGSSFGFFQLEEILEDVQLNERIRYLRLLGESGGKRVPETRWQMALAVDYLRLSGKPEQAVTTYLKYDRGLDKIPATGKLPLQGLISAYQGIDLKFTVNGGKTTFSQTLIADQSAYLKEFTLAGGSYIYLPRKQNYLLERNLRLERGMIFLMGDTIPGFKDRQGWQGDGRNSALHAMFRVYLGAETQNARYSLSQNARANQAPLRFYSETQNLQDVSTRLNEITPAGYHFILLDDSNRGAYLALAEFILQEMNKPGRSVEEAFFESQKRLADLYPLPRDHLSVVLVRN